MEKLNPFLNQVLHGDCIEFLEQLPEQSIDMIFADPPYNLQLQHELWRPNLSKVQAVGEAWDKFPSFEAYDQFTNQWLSACRRVLKDTGTIWVIGTYHNIYRVGSLMQDLGFWFLNDIVWIKSNPMPNFRGVRFTNAHEILLWASKRKGAKYTFNHHAMRSLNDDLQMRSDWILPICTGSERIKKNGKKAHSTQKPLSLLYRVVLASTQPGDVILDPFFGTGTTGVIATILRRKWIGIEQESDYVQIARGRISEITPDAEEGFLFENSKGRRLKPRISFASLVEQGMLNPGQKLYFKANREQYALIKSNGQLKCGEIEGSIHQVGSRIVQNGPCNGWEVWFFEDLDHSLYPIDKLRENLQQIFVTPLK